MAKPPETYAPNQNPPTWLSLWESWRRSRLRGQQRGMEWGEKALSVTANALPPPAGEARRRAAGNPSPFSARTKPSGWCSAQRIKISHDCRWQSYRNVKGSNDTHSTSARIVRPHCGPKKGQSSAKLNCPDGRHIPFHTPQQSTRLYPSVIWMVRLL